MPTEVHQIVPVFRILDVTKAREFYIDWLGFTVDWEHRFGDNFPLYMQVTGHGISLHLTEHYGDCLPGARIRVHISDIQAFHGQLAKKDYRYYKPGIKRTEWNSLEVSLLDPFGNHLVFTEYLKDKLQD